MTDNMRTKCAEALQLVLDRYGVTPIAEAVNRRVQTVTKWQRVPAEHVITVERVSGIKREILRPDLYPAAGSERQILLRQLKKPGPPLRSRAARSVL